jgi:hypothetical protein
VDPSWSDDNTWYLVQRKLIEIEMFPWNTGVPNDIGAVGDGPNHFAGGKVHWEYRGPGQPERNPAA